MNIEINRHTTPPGGWVFRQPQTGWKAPTPIASTFDQTVILILQHRKGNPAIVAKHNLPITKEAIGWELENFTRARLGVKAVTVPKTRPPLSSPVSSGGAVAVAEAKKAIVGIGVFKDWLGSGLQPVGQELATQRAKTCSVCPMNANANWIQKLEGLVAEGFRKTIEAQSALGLTTIHDAALKACQACNCYLKLKVWVPIEHIRGRTPSEQMETLAKVITAEDKQCWIVSEG